MILLLTDLFAMVLIDILGRTLPFSYAPSAHLGGMLAGWTYYQFFHEIEWRVGKGARVASRTSARTSGRDLPEAEEIPEPVIPGRSRTEIRAEVDRVLDKINSQGLGALTSEERQILDDAKDLISRR